MHAGRESYKTTRPVKTQIQIESRFIDNVQKIFVPPYLDIMTKIPLSRDIYTYFS